MLVGLPALVLVLKGEQLASTQPQPMISDGHAASTTHSPSRSDSGASPSRGFASDQWRDWRVIPKQAPGEDVPPQGGAALKGSALHSNKNAPESHAIDAASHDDKDRLNASMTPHANEKRASELTSSRDIDVPAANHNDMESTSSSGRSPRQKKPSGAKSRGGGTATPALLNFASRTVYDTEADLALDKLHREQMRISAIEALTKEMNGKRNVLGTVKGIDLLYAHMEIESISARIAYLNEQSGGKNVVSPSFASTFASHRHYNYNYKAEIADGLGGFNGSTARDDIPFQMIYNANFTLDDYIFELSNAPECLGRPLFMTMARVKSELYWQLIANFFFYT
jgi:hypothetical protein